SQPLPTPPHQPTFTLANAPDTTHQTHFLPPHRSRHHISSNQTTHSALPTPHFHKPNHANPPLDTTFPATKPCKPTSRHHISSNQTMQTHLSTPHPSQKLAFNPPPNTSPTWFDDLQHD